MSLGSIAGGIVMMRAAGTAIIVDITNGQMPSILHWGADLGDLTDAEVRALGVASTPIPPPNGVDRPGRLSILPEHWTGWAGVPGVSGSRAGSDWSPRFVTRRISIDGVAQERSSDTRVWRGNELLAEGVDPVARLGIEVVVRLDASGVVKAKAALVNLDETPYQLDELVIAFPVPSVASEVIDFAGRWANERVLQRRTMPIGCHRREGRRGRTGADSAMILHLGTAGVGFGSGEVWGVHTAWSGNHVHYAERTPGGEQVLGGGELLLPGELQLNVHERYDSPWVYAAYGHGLDEVAHRFHRLLRGRANHPRSPRPVTLNVWEAVYFNHEPETLIELAELGAHVGIERFVLDDGWFGARRNDKAGLGDWQVSSDVWPQGLHPLVDRVAALGMQFGLWVEPEMVNPDSDLARAHPEWVMAPSGRWPLESRHQQVLNLGIPACYASIRDSLCALLDEYDVAYLKWDHNRDLVDAGTQPSGRPGVHSQTSAFYRLLDELRTTYPNLEIESCSSGGSRVDLGVLERTDRVWASDNNDPLDRQLINRWTGQLVPPEMIGAHIASETSHTTERHHRLSFRAASAFFGHLGVEWDLRTASPSDLDELAAWIALHKQLRGILHHGKVVRVDHPDPSFLAHGVVSDDRSQAVFAVTSLAQSATAALGRIRFPGLSATSMYRVEPTTIGELPGSTRTPEWWTNETKVWRGSVLGSAGLVSPLLPPEHGIIYVVREVRASH